MKRHRIYRNRRMRKVVVCTRKESISTNGATLDGRSSHVTYFHKQSFIICPQHAFAFFLLFVPSTRGVRFFVRDNRLWEKILFAACRTIPRACERTQTVAIEGGGVRKKRESVERPDEARTKNVRLVSPLSLPRVFFPYRLRPHLLSRCSRANKGTSHVKYFWKLRELRKVRPSAVGMTLHRRFRSAGV